MAKPIDYSPNSELVENVLEGYEAGLHVADIADRANVSVTTVYRVLKKFNALADKRGTTKGVGVRGAPTKYNPPPKCAWHLEYERKKK